MISKEPHTIMISCQPSSHEFQERKIFLSDVIRIGRMVARLKPTEDNAIFDCKVLSRNHANIWRENGKVYMSDTKSSNGTFVNGQKLCKANEESEPKEVMTGDIIQFGVEVTENTTIHACIVAQITLLNSESVEIPRDILIDHVLVEGRDAPPEQLYLMQQYIREIQHRENEIDKKMCELESLVESVQDSCEKTSTVTLHEESLLSKVSSLDMALKSLSNKFPPENCERLLASSICERHELENLMKESINENVIEKLRLCGELSESKTIVDSLRSEIDYLSLKNKTMDDNLSKFQISKECEMKKMSERFETKAINEMQPLLERINELSTQLSFYKDNYETNNLHNGLKSDDEEEDGSGPTNFLSNGDLVHQIDMALPLSQFHDLLTEQVQYLKDYSLKFIDRIDKDEKTHTLSSKQLRHLMLIFNYFVDFTEKPKKNESDCSTTSESVVASSSSNDISVIMNFLENCFSESHSPDPDDHNDSPHLAAIINKIRDILSSKEKDYKFIVNQETDIMQKSISTLELEIINLKDQHEVKLNELKETVDIDLRVSQSENTGICMNCEHLKYELDSNKIHIDDLTQKLRELAVDCKVHQESHINGDDVTLKHYSNWKDIHQTTIASPKIEEKNTVPPPTFSPNQLSSIKLFKDISLNILEQSSFIDSSLSNVFGLVSDCNSDDRDAISNIEKLSKRQKIFNCAMKRHAVNKNC